jgi:hypothetical protein
MFLRLGSRLMNLDRIERVDLDVAYLTMAKPDALTESVVSIKFAGESPLVFRGEEAAKLRCFFDACNWQSQVLVKVIDL